MRRNPESLLQLKHMYKENQFSTIDLVQLGKLVTAFNILNVKSAVLEDISDAYKVQIPKYNPSDLYGIARNIQQRAHKIKTEKSSLSQQIAEDHWFLGEKSLFFCVLGFYAFTNRINIETITENQIAPLLKIFFSKNKQTLLFQVKHLLSIGTKVEWTVQDADLLENIMNQSLLDGVKKNYFNTKWKNVAYELFSRSKSGLFYSSRDCRNRWLSHLSPQINKSSWTTHEQLQLFQLISELGCKWALISRKMGGVRTEHMVKNKANSLIRAVFKKKFKNIMEKHITKIMKMLRERLQMEKDMKDNELNQQLSHIEIKLQEQRQNLYVQEPINSIKRSVTDFQEPFNPQRLIILCESTEQNWQYQQKYDFLDIQNILTLN